ncbi:MAG: hypothetical protein IJS50_02535 [Desulfovibrio sp.]|nr:hypothetical protein [Desulfovibrio sp.]
MEICLAEFGDQTVRLALRDGLVYLDDEIQPIKHLTEEELLSFQEELAAVPVSDDPGYAALIDAKRTQFIVSLLGRAVGEECIDKLTSLLDQLHFRVLQYLEEDECGCDHHGHA